MSGFISICNGVGEKEIKYEITEFTLENNYEANIDIWFKVVGDKVPTMQLFLYKNGEKTEITNNANYHQDTDKYFYSLIGLEYDTEYRIQIEVVVRGKSFRSEEKTIRTMTKTIIYGVSVDESNSNPDTCCSYIEDAIGVTSADSTSLRGWADKFPFNKVKIVGFKDGKETGDINPENKDHYFGGVRVPPDVDVMVKFPKFYWKFTKINNGYEIRISDKKLDGYDCFAHKVNGVEKDYIYIGCYEASEESLKLRSKSGVYPLTNHMLRDFREYAQAKGAGYQLFNYNTLKAVQVLFLIAYKGLDSQSKLGNGNSKGIRVETGSTFDKGLVYGERFKTVPMCFLGIEDLWGNNYQWVDGIYVNGTNIHINEDNKNFNDTGKGYKVIPYQQKAISGYISKVSGTNDLGFYPSECNGSFSTQYCDFGYYKSNTICRFGGNKERDTDDGIFCVQCDFLVGKKNSNTGARLVYLG